LSFQLPLTMMFAAGVFVYGLHRLPPRRISNDYTERSGGQLGRCGVQFLGLLQDGKPAVGLGYIAASVHLLNDVAMHLRFLFGGFDDLLGPLDCGAADAKGNASAGRGRAPDIRPQWQKDRGPAWCLAAAGRRGNTARFEARRLNDMSVDSAPAIPQLPNRVAIGVLDSREDHLPQMQVRSLRQRLMESVACEF
jgi:hypothetical protein